jgi:hypothetical protein
MAYSLRVLTLQDLAVDCHSVTYRRVSVLAWALLLLLPFGIPAFFGSLLYLNRARLSADTSSEIQYEVFEKICRSLHPNIDEETLKDIFEDVDADGSGTLSEQEVYSYAFFNELQRRVAKSRQAVAKRATETLRKALPKLALTMRVQHKEGIKHEDERGEDSLRRTQSFLLVKDIEEKQHDSDVTIHVGGIPELQARNEAAVADIFARFGKVAAITLTRRKYDGRHKNWALVRFMHPGTAKKALAANSDGTIAVPDRHEQKCHLRCAPYDIDAYFKGDDTAKRMWEEHQDDARARTKRKPWWFGDKDDFAFLVNLYRPSMYWFEVRFFAPHGAITPCLDQQQFRARCWAQIFVFAKKLILAGIMVFVDPGSITQASICYTLSCQMYNNR